MQVIIIGGKLFIISISTIQDLKCLNFPPLWLFQNSAFSSIRCSSQFNMHSTARSKLMLLKDLKGAPKPSQSIELMCLPYQPHFATVQGLKETENLRLLQQ